ncbi:MAG: hypothetical protein VKN56_07550 [Cyanobacteriota bacterium]|nr:hypothetical protein [Cyanobacteriota bacterium]
MQIADKSSGNGLCCSAGFNNKLAPVTSAKARKEASVRNPLSLIITKNEIPPTKTWLDTPGTIAPIIELIKLTSSMWATTSLLR